MHKACSFTVKTAHRKFLVRLGMVMHNIGFIMAMCEYVNTTCCGISKRHSLAPVMNVAPEFEELYALQVFLTTCCPTTYGRRPFCCWVSHFAEASKSLFALVHADVLPSCIRAAFYCCCMSLANAMNP